MKPTLKPFTDADRGELLALWKEALPLDAITEDVLETRVLLDENFDASTFLLAREGHRLVGFIVGTYARRRAMAEHDPEGNRCWITALGVAPDAGLARIGSALLEGLGEKFRTLGKKECWISTYPTGYFTPGVDLTAYATLVEFYRSQRFETVQEALSMDAPIVHFEVPPKVQEIEKKLCAEGITVRTYQRADLLQFLAFLEQAMPTDWMRVERANLRRIPVGGFRPDQVTVVTKGEEIIGYCQFEGSHFGPFGVSKGYQGRGIGTVLLARTLERMRSNGFHDAWVMWTDDVAAKVYAKFGFRETRRFAIMKKQI